jgi:hypothetical protein
VIIAAACTREPLAKFSTSLLSKSGVPHDLAKRNIKLFAERVRPRLKALDVACDIGGGAPPIAAE